MNVRTLDNFSKLHGSRSACGPRARAKCQPRRSRTPGFTLVEVICTITIMAIISGATSRILFQAFAASDDAAKRTELSNQLGSAMERIASEVRTIAIKTGSTPQVPDITTCTASTLTFNTPTSSRTITLSGSNLLVSGSAKASSIIATGVTSFVIQTYDKSSTALPASPSAAQIDTIRRIQVTITASSGGVSETLRTRFFVRCMALGSGSS